MKIDISAVAIVLAFVAPGYFAYLNRNHFAPRSLAPKGPTEEFAGFVVVSAIIHSILALVAMILAAVAGLAGMAAHLHPLWVFYWADQVDFQTWLTIHKSAGLGLLSAYFLLSCGFGYLSGLPLALLDLNWQGWPWRWVQSGKRGLWLRRRGVRGIFGEHPAIYGALRPDLDADGRLNYVLVEAQLRDSKGFYTGQVASYSISKDEDAHKLILLRDASFRPDDASHYIPVSNKTVLLDLADVLVLRIQQLPRSTLIQESQAAPVESKSPNGNILPNVEKKTK
jgi:hypothetical protein